MSLYQQKNKSIHPKSNVIWLAGTLFAAALLNLGPWLHPHLVPDFIALALIYWTIHQPKSMSITLAWLMGLVMDVHTTGLLGQYALQYGLLVFLLLSLHRRIARFSLPGQIAHALPIMLSCQIVNIAISLFFGGMAPPLNLLLQSVITTGVGLPLLHLVSLIKRSPS